MNYARSRRSRERVVPLLVLFGAFLVHCGSQSTPVIPGADAGTDAVYTCNDPVKGEDASVDAQLTCFPDHDGISGCTATIIATVDDTGFLKGGKPVKVLSSQNYSVVTFTLTNTGTKPHGFEVECTSVLPGYPDVAAGCPRVSCFPSDSVIAPLAPGKSKTVTFLTPIPDNLGFPIRSSDPSDCVVPGLNGSGSQWQLM